MPCYTSLSTLFGAVVVCPALVWEQEYTSNVDTEMAREKERGLNEMEQLQAYRSATDAKVRHCCCSVAVGAWLLTQVRVRIRSSNLRPRCGHFSVRCVRANCSRHPEARVELCAALLTLRPASPLTFRLRH